MTLAEWEELERIIEAVASRPDLEADLSISESDYEDYPDSQASTVDLTMLDDTTLDELYVNPDSHLALTRAAIDQVHLGNTLKISRFIQDLQKPGGVDGRTWTPFGEIPPAQTDSSLTL